MWMTDDPLIQEAGKAEVEGCRECTAIGDCDGASGIAIRPLCFS